jgi:hypothetical protein
MTAWLGHLNIYTSVKFQKKMPIINLKLDLTKAFDTIEHAAIIQVMKHKGFNGKWSGSVVYWHFFYSTQWNSWQTI